MKASYFERAKAYARRVAVGEEVAGRLEILACKRFLRDLERQGAPNFPYVIDERLGSRACQFQELLPHIKGEWAKPIYEDGRLTYARIVLEDWQVFAEFQLFGWVHVVTRLRRFRRSYEEIARKNAKSTRAAVRGLYLGFADGEPGSQVYSAATTGEQAREVFDVAREMGLRDVEFQNRFGVVVGQHAITAAATASAMKVMNAEASTQDGLNVHGAIVDEVHAHKKRDLWDVLDSADGARSQPLISAITTAGKDMSGICYELRGYTVRVLEGTHVDETWFGIIYTIDEGDDWTDPKIWRKANPNIGVSAKRDKLEAACNKAKTLLSARGNFLTKHLNVWTNAGSAWMDMEAWRACADPTLRDDAFESEEGYGGLDLAQKSDFAANVKVFQRDGIWHVFPRLYWNRQAAEDSTNAQMPGWIEAGHVHVSEGGLTDFDVIAQDMADDCTRHDMREIGFDPALAMYYAGKQLEAGRPMVEIGQRALFFTQALLQVEALVKAGKLRHPDNPVFNWMIANLVVVKSKFNELMQPTKDRDDDKIDGAIAMLIALGRALLLAEPSEKSFWEEDEEEATA